MFIIPASGPAASSVVSYPIERSLRFNIPDTAYLNRTLGAPTSARIMTVSFWAKLLDSSIALYHARDTAASPYSYTSISLDGNYKLTVMQYVDNATLIMNCRSDRVVRDPTAWMHIVVALNTTEATSAFRVKAWINNELVVWLSPSYPALNTNLYFANGNVGYVGRQENATGANAYCDGYLADFYHIDGQALDPSSFGRADSVTGVWGPKAYAGTYGAIGFHLDFADNSAATAAALGKDTSGNSNNWTPNNFSVTAGVGNDSLVDSPTSYGTDIGAGGGVRGNYCTWNPIWPAAIAPTNGNLDSPSAGVARGTMALLDFDAYWEITSTGGVSTAGVVSETGTVNTTTIASTKTYGFRLTTAGALDYKNITDAGAWTAITTGLIGTRYPYTSGAASTVASLNAGQRAFAATAPAGFKALCTQNLPTPTIMRGDDYMTAHLRTGTAAAFTVTGTRFAPDLVWTKSRTSASEHVWFDTERGVQMDVGFPTVGDQITSPTGVTAFNSDGFDGGALTRLNASAQAMVHWVWKKAPASGFDIVAYTGNSAASRKISHGLGVAPRMIIVKAITTAGAATGWQVYHASSHATAPQNERTALESSVVKSVSVAYWANTAPDNVGFFVGSAVSTNLLNDDYVAYLFAEIPGFSKFGYYTGNNLVDGPFVWCGFRPQWVLLRRADATVGNWQIHDAFRNPYNPVTLPLYTDLTMAEPAPLTHLDFVSNGFKLRRNTAGINSASSRVVFAAFAEHPFKYARAR